MDIERHPATPSLVQDVAKLASAWLWLFAITTLMLSVVLPETPASSMVIGTARLWIGPLAIVTGLSRRGDIWLGARWGAALRRLLAAGFVASAAFASLLVY